MALCAIWAANGHPGSLLPPVGTCDGPWWLLYRGLMARSAIDWDAAVRTGQRLAPTGPAVTPDEAAEVVAQLRRFSGAAELSVRATTGLGHDLPLIDADVTDRRGWIAATAQGMEALTGPLAARLPQSGGGRAVAGSQIGVVLGYLSGRVLGQYDPLGGDPASPGRLLLVAPNVVKVERELGADPRDFRMWVCLHEGTHRLQFTAVTWLREYFQAMVAEFSDLADTDPGEIARRAVAAIRGGRDRGSWIEAIQSPEQRVVFDRLLALMTLLEGHADHVMDAVGPSVVPSVTTIRRAFSARRSKSRGPIDRLLRALLGMDMKMAQYVKGAAFTTAVIERVGMVEFNAVWTSAETLPTRSEIADPPAWVRRVLG